MVRAFSMFGLGGLFLMISPEAATGDVHTALGAGVETMDRYAPYSYIAGGILVLHHDDGGIQPGRPGPLTLH